MLADLELQEVFNYFKTTKKYAISRIIVMKQFVKKNVIYFTANTNYSQPLIIAQKKVLLQYIQQLVTCDIFPTLMLVKNFAEEIYKTRLGKNWTIQFI